MSTSKITSTKISFKNSSDYIFRIRRIIECFIDGIGQPEKEETTSLLLDDFVSNLVDTTQSCHDSLTIVLSSTGNSITAAISPPEHYSFNQIKIWYLPGQANK